MMYTSLVLFTIFTYSSQQVVLTQNVNPTIYVAAVPNQYQPEYNGYAGGAALGNHGGSVQDSYYAGYIPEWINQYVKTIEPTTGVKPDAGCYGFQNCAKWMKTVPVIIIIAIGALLILTVIFLLILCLIRGRKNCV